MAATTRLLTTTVMFAAGLLRVDEPPSEIQGHISAISHMTKPSVMDQTKPTRIQAVVGSSFSGSS